MRHQTVQIDAFTKVSIVRWSEQEFNVLKLELNAAAEWDEVEEKELKSSMQVYGYLEQVRADAHQTQEQAREWSYTFLEALEDH